MSPHPGKMIIAFGEGEGEERALPVLIRKVLREAYPQTDHIRIADAAWRVGHLEKLRKNDGQIWKDKLRLASEKRGASAVLLLLDGDRPPHLGSPPHCVGSAAGQLAAWACQTGAGKAYSVAVVIARQEMESWFIAGAESLRGTLKDGGPGLKANAQVPADDLELSPRDAKRWLAENMLQGYKPTADQFRLAQTVSLAMIRQRKLRSFQRFEKAVGELRDAIISGQHVATPVIQKQFN